MYAQARGGFDAYRLLIFYLLCHVSIRMFSGFIGVYLLCTCCVWGIVKGCYLGREERGECEEAICEGEER